MKRPNLCIVTEFVKQGSLADLLADNTLKLPFERRMLMLRSAALGINYLHSLEPVIVHRDLKVTIPSSHPARGTRLPLVTSLILAHQASNLLVDENWNVKVADFGLARIKQENTTMTRCGTPYYTGKLASMLRLQWRWKGADVINGGVMQRRRCSAERSTARCATSTLTASSCGRC